MIRFRPQCLKLQPKLPFSAQNFGPLPWKRTWTRCQITTAWIPDHDGLDSGFEEGWLLTLDLLEGDEQRRRSRRWRRRDQNWGFLEKNREMLCVISRSSSTSVALSANRRAQGFRNTRQRRWREWRPSRVPRWDCTDVGPEQGSTILLSQPCSFSFDGALGVHKTVLQIGCSRSLITTHTFLHSIRVRSRTNAGYDFVRRLYLCRERQIYFII